MTEQELKAAVERDTKASVDATMEIIRIVDGLPSMPAKMTAAVMVLVRTALLHGIKIEDVIENVKKEYKSAMDYTATKVAERALKQ